MSQPALGKTLQKLRDSFEHALFTRTADGLMPTPRAEEAPYLLVLGVAQDAGVPQAGRRDDPGWDDPSRRRLATCLARPAPCGP